MYKYQLLRRDEYNQISIITVSEKISDLIEKGKKEVTFLNVDNALTTEDKKRNWEAYLIMIEPKDDLMGSYIIYAGKDSHGEDIVYLYSDNPDLKPETEKKIVKYNDIKGKIELLVYLGKLDNKDWFAEEIANRKYIPINSLKDTKNPKLPHPALINKMCFFVK